ncbi:MAG: LPXTG cell wall anchor domain-containing protein [Oscillospiraceae bacterium]|nr:LPXTG cell wall anchor domain-containing protein [Oscillospiraceae bacterium]
MKKIRHSWLFAALTIVLGVAVLSATLAAPSLRVVLNVPVASREHAQSVASANVPGEQSAVQATAAAQSAVIQVAASPQEHTDWTDWDSTSRAANSNWPALFDVYRTSDGTGSWLTQTVVDVFSTADGKPVVPPAGTDWSSERNSAYDDNVADAMRQTHDGVQDVTGTTRLLYPGTTGTYAFTLENKENFDITWHLQIADETGQWTGEDTRALKTDEIGELPVVYQLYEVAAGGADQIVFPAGNNTANWGKLPLTLGVLGAPEATLAANAKKDFRLEWKWAPEDGDAQNSDDTGFGNLASGRNADGSESTKDPKLLMPYYHLLFNIYAEGERGTFTVIWRNEQNPDEVYAIWDDVALGQRPEDYLSTHPGAKDPWEEALRMHPEASAVKFTDVKTGTEITRTTELNPNQEPDGENGLHQYAQLILETEFTAKQEEPDKPDIPWWVIVPLIPLIPLLPLLPFLPLIPLVPLLPFAAILPGWLCDLIKAHTKPIDPGTENPVDPTEPPVVVKPPKTGDELNLAPVYTLLALSMAGAVWALKKRKKDEQSE